MTEQRNNNEMLALVRLTTELFSLSKELERAKTVAGLSDAQLLRAIRDFSTEIKPGVLGNAAAHDYLLKFARQRGISSGPDDGTVFK